MGLGSGLAIAHLEVDEVDRVGYQRGARHPPDALRVEHLLVPAEKFRVEGVR